MFIIFLYPCELSAQGEFNNWYFGNKAGVCFNSGFPVPLVNGTIIYPNTSVSLSDSNGNFLFTSDGLNVYNKNLEIMPNGYGVHCTPGSGHQTLCAVQKLEDDSSYFLFTTGPYNPVGGTSFGLLYSIINMRLDSGLGDVELMLKNIPVPGAEKAYSGITATRHKNNKDAWVITRLYDQDSNFYASYLITHFGLSLTPMYSNCQISFYSPPGLPNEIRISPDGNKLLCFFQTTDTVEYCLFNTSNGQITGLFKFIPGTLSFHPSIANSAEFSVDSKFLYLTCSAFPYLVGESIVYQYEADKTDSLEFIQSETIIEITPSNSVMKMGPDWKIYGTQNLSDSLLVINKPSVKGIGCNLQINAVPLLGNDPELSLPVFLQRYYIYPNSEGNCQGEPVDLSATIWTPADSLHWDFGDPASGSANFSNDTTPSHVYNLPGQYTIELFVRHIDNRTDTSWINITIDPTPAPDLGPDQTICTEDSVTFDAGACTGCSYYWDNITTGQTGIATTQTYRTGEAGDYRVGVTNTFGCSGIDTISLSVTQAPEVTTFPLSDSICSGETTNIQLISNLPNTGFSWTVTLISGNITGFSADSGTVIAQTLLNPGTDTGLVVYHIVPKIGSCLGDTVNFSVTVTPADSVLITIIVPEDTICAGTSITCNAFAVNGGTIPSYQWQVNSVNQWTNNPEFTFIPSDGDIVSCILTSSNTICTSNNPDTSNTVLFTVYPQLPLSISISASLNPVCGGIPILFSAYPVNEGSSPNFQWQVNGINTGTNSNGFTYLPSNNDVVSCILTSYEPCTSGNPASSNPIIMLVGESPVVTLRSCFDTITTTNAKPIHLKGGIPLGGTYSGPGVDQITGYFNPAMAGVGLKTISYSYTNQYNCSNNATRTITVINPAPLTCGDSLTDIRDNRKYPTIQIGSQCWLAANLNYGVQISGSQSQRDNCITEKYCYNDIPELCALSSALYQWDELMRYEDSEEIQGLCPPGWHVPSEADWDQLFAVYQGNAFAGSPLLFTGYSGFNVLLAGVEFFNQSNRFADFASIMWSSTSHGPYKAWSHGLNEYNYSVSYYPSYRSNAFSVRCVRD